MLGKMLALAATAHKDQKDKGGQPYFLHCLAVMQFAKDAFGNDEELLCIALGHDLLEDTDTSPFSLIQCFGVRVTEGIKSLTKTKGQSYSEYKVQVMSNPDAVKVKMYDLQHNSDITRLKGVTDKDLARQAKYQQFYTELKDTFNVSR